MVTPSPLLVDPLVSTPFNITCVIPSHPLVMITWDTGSIPFTQLQLPTGFNGPVAESLLTINSSNLAGTHFFNCSGQLDGVVSTETAVVNAYSKLENVVVVIAFDLQIFLVFCKGKKSIL